MLSSLKEQVFKIRDFLAMNKRDTTGTIGYIFKLCKKF